MFCVCVRVFTSRLHVATHKLTHFVIDCCVIFILDLLNVILSFVCVCVSLATYYIFFYKCSKVDVCAWRVSGWCSLLSFLLGFCDYETKDDAVASLYERWTTFLISVWQLHVNVHHFFFCCNPLIGALSLVFYMCLFCLKWNISN